MFPLNEEVYYKKMRVDVKGFYWIEYKLDPLSYVSPDIYKYIMRS